MTVSLPFRPKLIEGLRGMTRDRLRQDVVAGVNVAILAFPLSLAFAIASGVKPEQGLYASIISGGIAAALGGSRVQISGPTGAFVIITGGVIATHGLSALLLCTMMAGAMLCLMGSVRLGSIIRYIPYPVSRAFTKGIAVLILSSQIKPFLGLSVATMPADVLGKLRVLFTATTSVHAPTVVLSVLSVAVIALWPKRLSRYFPGAMVGLIAALVAVPLFGLQEHWQIATLDSEFGPLARSLPAFALPAVSADLMRSLIPAAFTIALLAAMQALLCAVVTDGLIDDRHDSNQELVGQGLANLCGPLFGCIPVTGAVARSVLNVRTGGRTPVAALVQCGLLLALLLAAGPLLGSIPLATLSAILVVAACRMVSWKQFLRLTRWPASDSSVFLATFGLTVLADLTLAVEVGMVLAALLTVKRVVETSQITAVDESTETEGSQHSLIGKEVPEGVLIFRVFGAFFFGVVDKLDDELKRAKREPQVLILRIRKVLAIDATGLQALDDLRAKLQAKGKHLIISAPHTQPLAAMIQSGFVDRLGEENICPDITAALARSRAILNLPPQREPVDPHRQLLEERRRVEAARRELTEALNKAQQVLQTLDRPRADSP